MLERDVLSLRKMRITMIEITSITVVLDHGQREHLA